MALVSIDRSYYGASPLIQKYSKKLDWDRYPVQISESLLEAISMELVKPILSGICKQPSEIAKIKEHEILDPTIHLLDSECRQAYKAYANSLADAVQKDWRKIRITKARYSIRSYDGAYGLVFGTLQYFGARFRSKEFVQSEGSAHRIKWLIEVDIREKDRREKIKKRIKQALDDIANRAKLNPEKGVELVGRSKQLLKLFKAIFPSEEIVIDGLPTD